MSTDLHVRARRTSSSALRRPIHQAAALAFFAACCAFSAHAAPMLFIEESATLRGPEPADFRPFDVGVFNNEIAVVAGTRDNVWNLHRYEEDRNGEWQYAELLFSTTPVDEFDRPSLTFGWATIGLAQRNAFHYIYQPFGQGSWWEYANTIPTPEGFGEMGADIESGRSGGAFVVAGETNGRFQAIRFYARPRVEWVYGGHVDGNTRADTPDFFGGDIATEYESTAVGSPAAGANGRIHVASGPSGDWSKHVVLSPPPGQDPSGFGRHLGMSDRMLIATSGDGILHLYNGANWAWSYESSIRSPDTSSRGIGSPVVWNDRVAYAMSDDDRGPGTGSIALYRREGSRLQQVAELYSRDSVPLTFSNIDMDTRTLVASSDDRVLVFQLPPDFTVPAIIQDDFEQGAGAWMPALSGVWSIATVGTNQVYRQTDLGGAAHSIRTDSNWENQSVQADIRPRVFQSSQSWFGLAARYRDANNHYYVTVRSDGTLALRKKVNGVLSTLDSARLVVSPDQPYRVRLEAIGTRIRVYIDERLMLEAIDDSLSRGRAALFTFRTRADFDNVLVSPNPLIELFSDTFEAGPTDRWRKTMGTWLDPVPSRTSFLQTSIGGVARASAGAPADDQIVQAEIMPTRMVSPASWVGVFARHTNDANYYYLKLGNDGQASLRKVVDSSITELAHAPFTVQPNVVYRVRLEAVGSTLRAYVNERFLFSATDTSHPTGRYGLITNTSVASFDDVRVHQP